MAHRNTYFENEINKLLSAIDTDIPVRDIVLRDVVDQYATIPGAFQTEPEVIASNILTFSQLVVSMHNSNIGKGESDRKWTMPKTIEPFQIALCMLKINHAIVISFTDDSADGEVAVYCEDGINKGLYTTDRNYINKIIYSYNFGIQKNAVDEVISRIYAWGPRKTRSLDPDLIPVNNGIFNYKTKQLLDFDPEYVFTAKSGTDYNFNARNIMITNPDGTQWDIESWMEDLTDDPQITQLLWEITGALLRPNVAWNKSAWLYSDRGENGKGTLCALWRNLCGNSATSIPIADFSKDFMLSSLFTSQAIIVDENDVGSFIDRAGALKAIITNDVVYINRKFKDPIHYQFHGFMVQCLNEMPRFRDKSDSIYRRQLFIPMNKCFTGFAKTYIKTDYINRKEVLEYVMKHVLEMTSYYTLSEPDACKLILNEYKMYNDPVRQFWAEFEDRFVWDLLPYSFLYSLFKEWFKRNNPNGSIIGRNTFMKDLQNVVMKSDKFMVPEDKNGKIRALHRMDKTETLIAEYNLVDWQTPGMSSKLATVDAICRPIIADNYRGILRIEKQEEEESTDSVDEVSVEEEPIAVNATVVNTTNTVNTANHTANITNTVTTANADADMTDRAPAQTAQNIQTYPSGGSAYSPHAEQSPQTDLVSGGTDNPDTDNTGKYYPRL